jgi:hypothetical protein
MEKRKYDRIKILGILVLVFVVVPLITMSASAQNYNNNYMRSFPYGAPTLYQQNNMSYIGPFTHQLPMA